MNKKIRTAIYHILSIAGSPLSVWAVNKFFPEGIKHALDLISAYSLPILLLITLIISVASIEFVYLLNYRNKSKLKLIFNVFWDRNRNPYCPACRLPLIIKKVKDTDIYYCLKCKEYIFPTHKRGQSVDLDSVHNMLLQNDGDWFNE